ncbi:peptidylprolyl isomerase [Candidatus Uabimicrobium amorphum]|uniref:peptidylprolyl isomerase n=1 Tax=Uabimicrobium amorphum TaxID=2596890 RepID=A0A5S9IUG7_UABAM|nr:peptidylprolyl isomerase [Candidatus Uabimicrobium amorphum]BBM88154.1 foldase protein PrsA [Candidatus Uabimicrobium amorphum]
MNTFVRSLVVLLSLATLTTSAMAQNNKKNVIVKFHDYQITKEDVFDLFVRQYPLEANEVIRQLVVRYIIRKEVEKEKVKISRNDVIQNVLKEINETKKKLKELGKSWTAYLKSQGGTERDLKRNLFIKWRYSLSVQQLIRLFELRRKHIEARHIMVETKEEAQDIISKLNKGADFAALAKQKSKAMTTKDEGGKLPIAFSGELPPDLEKKIWNMKPKQISNPILSQNAYHVVEVLSVHNGFPNASWSSIKNEIQKSLKKRQPSPRDFKRWLNHMKKEYKATEKLE